jgi:hypothetical protein
VKENVSVSDGIYSGGFDAHGRRHGRGILRAHNGTYFEGYYIDDLKNRYGVLVETDGSHYRATF